MSSILIGKALCLFALSAYAYSNAAQPFDTTMHFPGKKISSYVLYEVAHSINGMQMDDRLRVVTENYPALKNDILTWVRISGIEMVSSSDFPDSSVYVFQKSAIGADSSRTKVAMVISKDDLENLLTPLGFALSSAISGADVSIFFQGPAVRVLKSGFNEKLPGFNAIFSGFARNGLKKIGHLPPQDKVRQLKELGAHFYICGPSMEHFKVKSDELIFDDITKSEYFTVFELFRNANVQVFLQ
jgi:predicted peroxiredoxin